jgi:ABC-2 type transport system permease protein
VAGLLIRMKLAVVRNSLAGKRSEDMISGGVTGLLLAVATIYLGTLRFAHAGVAFDLMAVAMAVWAVGWIVGPSMFGGGDETLRPEIFALLPIHPRRLAFGLLGAAFIGVAPLVSLLAFGGLVAVSARLGPAAVAVAVLAVPLQLVLVILLSRLTTALLNQVMRTRTGAAVSAAFSAAIMAFFGSGWALFPAIGSALDTGFPAGLARALRVFPTGWGLAAVEAAGRSDWAVALGALAGLTVLCGLLLLGWAAFLVRRITTRPSESRGQVSESAPVTARGPVTAVLVKEWRTWMRDLRRFHFYLFALFYALIFCGLPLAVGATAFLPWTGLLFALMAAAMSAGLYSEDGTGLWSTLLTPGATGPDVRGRQLAWLAVVAPVAMVLTVSLTAATGHHEQWLLLLGLLPAVLGAAGGLIVLLSLARLIPIADPHKRSGNMMENPTDFAQVLLSLVLTAAAALPTFVVAQQRPWLGVLTGCVTGAGLFWLLGTVARLRLEARGPELLQLMRSGPTRRPPRPLPGFRTPLPGPLTGLKLAATRTTAAVLLTVCWIPLFPQGIVPAVMLLTNQVTPSWFLALHLPGPYQWPVTIGMIAVGVALGVTGLVLMRRAPKPAA